MLAIIVAAYFRSTFWPRKILYIRTYYKEQSQLLSIWWRTWAYNIGALFVIACTFEWKKCIHVWYHGNTTPILIRSWVLIGWIVLSHQEPPKSRWRTDQVLKMCRDVLMASESNEDSFIPQGFYRKEIRLHLYRARVNKDGCCILWG